MGKIYVKELKSYFNSVFGWLFLAIFTAICSLFIVSVNLYDGVPYISYSVRSVVVILMFVFPLLTMRILALEKRNKTDQLLLTAPIRVSSVILGKFFALVTMICMASLIFFAALLIVSQYGEVSYKESLLSIFALILFGAVLCSIGVFMSALTEHQIIAAVLTYAAYIFILLVPSNLKMFVSSNTVLVKILNAIDLISVFDRPFSGILNAKDILYALSVIVIFLLLATRVFGKSALSVSLVGIKKFWFTTIGLVAIIGIIIGANIAANQINDKYVQIDMTKTSFFSLSNDSKELVSNLDREVTIHVLNDETKVDGTLKMYLKQYESYGKKIKVVYHSLKTQEGLNFYRAYVSEQPTDNSVIVTCGDRFRVVNYEDMYIVEYGMDPSTYQTTENVTGLDLEGQITSAINYVLSDQEYKVYFANDHGEIGITDKTKEQLEKAGFSYESFSFLKNGTIPEDCNILVLMGPDADYSKDNIKAVKEYIDNGGQAVFFASPDSIDTPEYDKLMSSYGAKITDGMIWEGDQNYMLQGYPYLVISDAVAHPITNGVYSKKKVNLIYYPRGFILDDSDPNISVESLLTSTNTAYEVKVHEDGTVETKEGTSDYYSYAYYAEVINKNAKAKIVCFSTPYFLVSEPDELTSYANTELFVDSLCYICDMSLDSAVPAKSYDISYMMVPANTTRFFFVVLIIVIPLLELAAGIVITLVRRKK